MNGIDPSGEFTLIEVLSVASIVGTLAIAIVPSLLRIHGASRSLLALGDMAIMLGQSSLDPLSQVLIRNMFVHLATSVFGTLFDEIGNLANALIRELAYLVVTTAVITAAFVAVAKGIKWAATSHSALRVASGGAAASANMSVVRTIQRGEKIVDIVDEVKKLTFTTGREHAVVKLANGQRAIVSGGSGGIDFASGQITRLFGHSHPYFLPATGPSGADFKMLEQLNQVSSYILEHGDLYKFTRLQ